MHKYIKRFFLDYTDINEYYNYLIDKTKHLEYVGISNEWLIDNFYLIVEHKNNLLKEKKQLNKKLKKCSIYSVLKDIIEENGYNINYKKFIKEIDLYQKKYNSYFTYEEISMIPTLLLFIYISKLNIIYKNLYKESLVKEEVKKIIKEMKNSSSVNISSFMKDEINLESNYIFEINNQLRELGIKTNSFFKDLNKLLEKNNISLKVILNEEYQKRIDDNLLVSNIFNNLKDFCDYSVDDLTESISKCEKSLLDDKIYRNMTSMTKNMYRKKICKLAKKEKITEFKYVENLFKNIDSENYHVGFQLFKNKNNSFNIIIYIFIILFLTVLTSIFLSNYFIKCKLLGVIILLIPISQLYIQIINNFLSSIVKTQALPKMDYSKKIPEESATMVVIPTIIGDTKKIKEMFDKLETFYIVNKSDNLYFTLLGDVKASSKKVCDFDQEISDYGVMYATKLNEKYKKNLFHFVYRKRIWNDGENSYLGYERKRGALLQFNQLLLKKTTKSFEEKYFNVHTFNDFDEKIKYVLTIDTDTKLVLNSILNLVGCMAHPLNKPILNKEATKVISGYGLMQPRINIDVESTNKSLYSQIFAGIGGFDTYSIIVPNVNQDCFFEGSFVGKGIYDLETFDKILYDKFPDNLILSHDLLEGNYLRSGYVGDIEVIDDFPSKFLIDVTRHHRWARGDVQIIGFLFSKVRNKRNKLVKNPINILGKWKIFDNISRMFLYPSLLLMIILTLFLVKNKLIFFALLFFEIFFPILTFLRSKFYTKRENKTTVYYKKILFGGKTILLRSYIVLSTIPYYSYLYMDAFIKSIYRLTYSHKNLLNWITAEEVEKTAKSDLLSYLKSFKINLFLGTILIIGGIFLQNIMAIVIGIIFISSPFVLYYVSRDIDVSPKILLKGENVEILSLARKTWLFFKDNLNMENNFLIPDNYQENREIKIDFRTSPTNIGFSLTSIIAAYELNFITREESITYLKNILLSIDSLEKWNGHLYNWYNIKTKEVMPPRFVSTVDSGNLVASLIIVREYLNDCEEIKLRKLCDKLIKNADFKKLYTDKEVFSIGFLEEDGKLSVYNYNKFASESRLTSFIAICKGDVLSKHWFCLDKSLTTYNYRKGLISWNGTSFEYFMPLLYMKNYPNTLLDESYSFAHYCQKSYISEISRRLPWGISEAAYNELDNSENYKYKSFSIPLLKAKEDKDTRIVISPYSSLMVMSLYPDDVYENILKFKRLNMMFKYGLYESYDYENRGVVRACFAHHQGMSLMGLTNYLKNNVMQEYFFKNVNVRTFDILLKEKVQVKANIDMKMAKYKKYNYKKESIQNDIRSFDYISYMPEISILSNKKYTLLINDRGTSFSRYRTLQLNRYRKVTEQDYGMFLYIKDISTNKIWSNTYAPINIKPDKYEVVFASDMIKYVRHDGKLITKTEIIVTRDHNAEIRKFTFKNDSEDFKVLELTSYTEPILSENTADISHKVFNNMFLSSEYDINNNSLIMIRKNRKNSSKCYMVNRLLIEQPVDAYSYETDRFNFIGRNNNASNPIALNSELSNDSSMCLEPIMSIRNRIEIAPNSSKEVYFICGFGRSREQINSIINTYNCKDAIDKAFHLSNLMNIVETKKMNLTGEDMRTYNIMLNYLYQTTKISINDERRIILKSNTLAQNGLWKFGISGDRPIILVNVNDISDLSFVYDILKAFEYFKNKSIFVDIIIVNGENSKYSNIVKKEIEEELYRIYNVNDFYHTPGSVTVIPIKQISSEEESLLREVPRLIFDIKNHKSLKDEVEILQKSNKINRYKVSELENNLDIVYDDDLKFNNEYGGFKNNGKEYEIITKNTPTPWSNVIANDSFGTIITNNGCGYTYFDNSSEFKITSWTNEMINNDKSEGIKINGKIFDPTKCIHGFGYSILESETNELKHILTEFISKDDNVKIYILKLINKGDKKQKLDISFWINPVFGNFEEKTSRHILTEFMGCNNYLMMRNVYSIDYSDVNVFMSSSEKIVSVITDKILVKDISVSVELDSDCSKEIVFTLGCERNDCVDLIKKYNNLDIALKELNKVKKNWDNSLSTIKVKTPDDSFNYMINGWYLYQTMSSRIMAKAGYYQVSGAFGYRDQLQDSMNICNVNPVLARHQILINARHQFIEGDVLHWWHEKNHFGLRSRYKDDYLWLVYATLYYLRVTDDKSILEEKIPFVVGDKLTKHENERGMIFNYSVEKETLFNHLVLALDLSMSSLGKHNLPLMGGGDWNDGMNKVGIKGTGESVWLGFFLYDIINKFIEMLQKYYKDIEYDSYINFCDKLKVNLNESGWDKDYYLRAYFDNGDKLGSIENEECKIDLISQSFAILSDVILENRISSVIGSVEKNLVDSNNKIIKLLDPAFSSSLNDPGYIMNYPKGIRENGGQYTHAVSWYIMALIKIGKIDKAYEYYQMINPINRSLSKGDSNTYKVEPYVISADIYSKRGYEGRGGWTWYTGSAGWFYRVGIEEILGFKKYGNKLIIKPNVPTKWNKFNIIYKYNKTIYNIKIIKSNKNELIIDDKIKKDNIINLDNKKDEYNIQLYFIERK